MGMGVMMMVHVKVDACEGCGACVQVCPAGAVRLFAGKAVINAQLCTACEACVEACPTAAITVAGPLAQAALADAQFPATARPEQKTQPAPGGLALWTGIALALVEHRIVPRLADAFVAALEQWLSRPKPAPTTALWQNTLRGKVGHGPTYRHRRRSNRSV